MTWCADPVWWLEQPSSEESCMVERGQAQVWVLVPGQAPAPKGLASPVPPRRARAQACHVLV